MTKKTDKKESLILTGIAHWTKIAEPATNDRGELEYTMDLQIEDASTITILKRE